MNEKEMRELDAWIAEHVMEFSNYACLLEAWRPTKRPQDAMDVLKKCAEKCSTVIVSKHKGDWNIGTVKNYLAKSETLELSICLAAKQLFSKEVK